MIVDNPFISIDVNISNFIRTKTHNKHPHWYNQPLHLNDEQRRNPLEVFEEFFQCYHLNETRQTMWEWLAEVISSPHKVSSDPHYRDVDEILKR